MKALTWQGTRKVSVEEVPDPRLDYATDAIVQITSTAICGSDLHLYEVLGMFLEEGDILGHEAMGVVEDVGAGVTNLAPGDRVVVPFNISCGTCFMCSRRLYAQCETTQVHAHDKGAALYGYTKLYGQVPGGQAEYLRVPQAQFGPIKVPQGPPDERFLFLSDVLPTAWQAVSYADVPQGASLGIFGLGPIGQMCVRIAKYLGIDPVFGVDLVPERLAMAERYGAITINAEDDPVEQLRDATNGRGPDSVNDGVGMQAHGAPVAAVMQRAGGFLPKPAAAAVTEKVGIDRLSALYNGIDAVRRGGTLSVIGVYGGAVDPLPMMQIFDKGIQLRVGQAHVRRWTDEIMPLLLDGDPLGTEDFATHHLPLADAPDAYRRFQRKEDGMVKVVLRP
jgi:threonine dehydrogenase-like Zn-dependent dehydrogenase